VSERTGWRLFMASPTEVTVHNVSPQMDQAMDVLLAAGMLGDKSISLITAAERDGKDPVKFAHHLVGIASALREAREPT